MNSKIFIKKNEERRINSGHLWIFSNEIDRIEGDIENGDTVFVYDFKNNLAGTAFYNKNSLIAARLLSKTKIDDLSNWLEEKIVNAYRLRKIFYPERESFRMVFSESDFLPGLIIDKYNNTFVLQVYSAGMEKNIDLIIQILKEKFSAENIFTKNESYFRKLEGLPEENKMYLGNKGEEIISDGKITYKINFTDGQKTGFYFDQSDNRFFIEKFCKGKTVLDAFCNSGGFGLHAASAEALKITFVDSSAGEINSAEQNFKLNNFKNEAEFITSDVFDYLQLCVSKGIKFDVVMIDPPAFAKNKKSLPAAKKGYKKLNKLALQCLNPKGFLVTSSCSFHLEQNEFLSVVNSAFEQNGIYPQMVHFNKASMDHPELSSMRETSYLKFAVFFAD